MANEKRANMKQLVAVVERGDGRDAKSFWTRIGVAFQNKDGSWNLRFDYFPTDPKTTVQLRDIEERDDRRPARGEARRDHRDDDADIPY